MARIQGVPAEKAGLWTRIAYWYTKRSFGRLMEAVKITAHNPQLLRGVGKMEMAQKALLKSVDPVLVTLAELKVAMMVGCPF
jgi:hypothetical protein